MHIMKQLYEFLLNCTKIDLSFNFISHKSFKVPSYHKYTVRAYQGHSLTQESTQQVNPGASSKKNKVTCY